MTDEETAEEAPEEEVSEANLEDVFESETEDTEEVEETPAKTPEPEEEQKGEEEEEPEAGEAEEEAEPPAAEEDEDEVQSVPVAALKSERQKRQAAEAELNELKSQIPEEDVDDETFSARATISRDVMVDAFPDYEEMETIFTGIAKGNKALRMEMRNSPNPAKFAYSKAKEHLEIEEIKSLKSSDDWDSFQKWKKSEKDKPVKETPEAKRKKSVLEVPNINKAASLGSNSPPREELETLDDIFED